ncbi:MAG: hypothetical protein IT373_35255 [Polyangiaceae bacterium]|nr:hypothetical protein [Polyangiaceae bacterium]
MSHVGDQWYFGCSEAAPVVVAHSYLPLGQDQTFDANAFFSRSTRTS